MSDSLIDKFFMVSSKLFVSSLEQISTVRRLTEVSTAKDKRVDIATEYKLNLLKFHRV